MVEEKMLLFNSSLYLTWHSPAGRWKMCTVIIQLKTVVLMPFLTAFLG